MTRIGRTATLDVETSDTIDKVKDRRADHEISVKVLRGVEGVGNATEDLPTEIVLNRGTDAFT